MKYLICGLGNPGNEYEHTRHNIGFSVLDALAWKEGLSFGLVRHGWMSLCRFKGRQLLLLKPNTYMNLSGKAIHYWLQQEKIALQNLLVITDDLALPFGTLRLKAKGSDGGHNGLKSIQDALGSTEYPRLRIGIGNDFRKGGQSNYVLSRWAPEEEQKLEERLAVCGELIKSFVSVGIQLTMTGFNNK